VAVDGTAELASGTAFRLSAAEGRLLPRMPLHAITSVPGEAGLRERLLTTRILSHYRSPTGCGLRASVSRT
jgi:hypothetical protein